MAEQTAMTEVEYSTVGQTVKLGDSLRVCYKSVYGSGETEMSVTVEDVASNDTERLLTVETEKTSEVYRLRFAEDSAAQVLTERKNGWARISEEGSVEVLTEVEEDTDTEDTTQTDLSAAEEPEEDSEDTDTEEPQLDVTGKLSESEEREAVYRSVFLSDTYANIGDRLGVSGGTVGKIVRHYKSLTGTEAESLEEAILGEFGDLEEVEEDTDQDSEETETDQSEPDESAAEEAEEDSEPAAEFVGSNEEGGFTLLQYSTKLGDPVGIVRTGEESASIHYGAGVMTEEVGEAIARHRGITEWSLSSDVLYSENLPEWLLERVEEPEDTDETEAAESAAEEVEDTEESDDTDESEPAEDSSQSEDSEDSEEVDILRLKESAERLGDLGILSEGQAAVYLAREVHGLGRAETAEALDMAATTTDTHRQRAIPKVEKIEETLDLLSGYKSVANGEVDQ